MDDNIRSSTLTAQALLMIVRRRLWVVVLTITLVVGGTVALSLLQEEKYSATASLLFRDPQLDQKLFGSSFLQESPDPAREAATNVSLVSLDEVAVRTADEIGDFTSDEVSEKVAVEAEGQSDLVSVTATDPSPRFAATLANTFASEYIAFRQEADREKIRSAQRLVRDELSELQRQGASESQQESLAQRLEQLTVLASLQTGNAELVQQAASPSSPASPNLVANTAIAVLVGLALGLALALLLDRIDRRLRDPDEIGAILDRPVLGVVPASEAIRKEGADVDALPEADFEAFRMIRANLRFFGTGGEVNSILVNSAASGDGKTTVAWNLAAAAASAGADVVLLEADLRRPVLRQRLGVGSAAGLSQVLAGVRGLDEAVVQVPIGQRGSDHVARSVDVVFAGPPPPNPTDLLESERMEEVLQRLEIRYDTVFIDTPPATTVSDAIPLLSRVSGVVVVSRLNQTDRHMLGRLANQLETVKAPVLGVVVNGIEKRRGAYGYGYGYGGGSQPPGERSADPIVARSLSGNGVPTDLESAREGERTRISGRS